MMRLMIAALVAAAIPATAALAQPARPPAPKGPPGKSQAAQQPAPLPIFPCRTEGETCFLGIVVGGQVAIVYTNAQSADGLEKPVDVAGPDGAKLDLAQNAGRVVMLAGSYDAKTGIKGELVEVASPLVSLSIKAQLAGGGQDAPPPPGAAPKRR
jgi:hypothetical protein